MAQKSSGSQQGTRHKLSRKDRSGTTVNDYVKDIQVGEKVRIEYEPSVQEGRSHHRYHGRTAEVTGFRGNAAELEIDDGEKVKTLYLKPVHLKRIDQ